MTLKELLKDKEFIQRVEACLNSSYKNALFYKGLILFPSNNGNQEIGVFGFNSKIKAKLTYRFDESDSFFEKTKNIIIDPLFYKGKDVLFPYLTDESILRLVECNYDLKKTGEVFEGKIKLDKNKPLSIDVLFDTTPQKIFRTHNFVQNAYTDEALKKIGEIVVNEIKLPNKKDVNEEERKSFPFGNLKKILDWFKKNMVYEKIYYLDLLKTIENKKGACLDFATLFKGMVYVAGGLALNVTGTPFNLPLESEHNYFSLYPSGILQQGHELNCVFYDGEWHLVDPTIYTTTFQNPKISEGLEKRAYSSKLENYYMFKFYLPKLELRDGESEETSTVKSKSNHKIILPEIELDSIKILS